MHIQHAPRLVLSKIVAISVGCFKVGAKIVAKLLYFPNLKAVSKPSL